jgi:hypothetical protein
VQQQDWAGEPHRARLLREAQAQHRAAGIEQGARGEGVAVVPDDDPDRGERAGAKAQGADAARVDPRIGGEVRDGAADGGTLRGLQQQVQDRDARPARLVRVGRAARVGAQRVVQDHHGRDRPAAACGGDGQGAGEALRANRFHARLGRRLIAPRRGGRKRLQRGQAQLQAEGATPGRANRRRASGGASAAPEASAGAAEATWMVGPERAAASGMTHAVPSIARS